MAVSDIPHVLLLLDQGKSMEALELSAKLIEEMPTHVTSYVVHARANESQGQYEQAFRSWRQALDLMPNSPQIRKGLMRTAEKLARPSRRVGDSLNWLRDRRQDSGAEKFLAEHLYGSGLASDTFSQDAPASSGDHGVRITDRSAEVPVFVDTDLPTTDTSYELDFNSSDVNDSVDTSGQTSFSDATVETDKDTLSRSAEQPERAPAETISAELDDEGVVAGTDSASASEDAMLWSEQSLDQDQNTDDVSFSGADASAGQSAGGLDDLDSLIVELESARIVPRPDDDPAPAPDLESNVDGMVSETLANIYAAQSQYKESARIFAKLAEMHPDRADEFHSKAAEMRSKVG